QRKADGIGHLTGSVCLDGCSAFWAQEWATLGDGPPDGVDDIRESHFRDLTGCLDCSMRGAASGLGLDFLGHGFLLFGWVAARLPSEWQPAEFADSDEEARGSPGRHDH